MIGYLDLVNIVDGQGFGQHGQVVQVRKTVFGHVFVAVEVAPGVVIDTLESKVRRV